MNEGRIQYVKKNMFWSAIVTIVSTVFPFILRTLFVHYLGSEYLGLNSLCLNILYVLNAADLGVANAFVFRLYKPASRGDLDKVCRLLYFYRSIYQKIGVVIFVAGLLVLPFLNRLIKDEIPSNINIYLVFFIFLLNTVVSYVFWAYSELVLIAHQRRSYADIISCCTLSVMYSVQIYFVMHEEYYGYLLIMPVVTIFANAVKRAVMRKRYPDYRCEKGLEEEDKRAFFKDAFSVAVYKLRDISRNAFDSVVISAFVGLVALSDYQNYYTVLIVPIILRQILVTAVAPSMGNCIVLDDQDKVYQIYKLFAYVHIYVSGWFAIFYGILISDFVNLWLGGEFVLDQVFTLLFVVYFYVLGFGEQTKMIRESAGLWEYGRVCAGLEMGLNILLNVLLVWWLGSKGVLIATIITIVLINIPVENYIIFHDFFHKGIGEMLFIYGKALLWFLGTGGFCAFLCSYISLIGVAELVCKVMICVIVPAGVFVLCNFRTMELKILLSEIGMKKKESREE